MRDKPVKLFVVHDTTSHDVFIETLHTSREYSLSSFFNVDHKGDSLAGDLYMKENPHVDGYYMKDLEQWFESNTNIVCEEVSISLLTRGA
tara:strand:+ start:265 stop:534 length:270 start_codon:yes stop_codon:yes gene_type:complete